MTEREYLQGVCARFRNPLVEVEVGEEQGVPLTLVRLAVARKEAADAEAERKEDDLLRYDEVWCVHDVDEHPNLNDARQLAGAKGIDCAVSNPCFELWLILHLRESPGPRHRHDVQKLLRALVPGYDKHLTFVVFAQGYDRAVERAARLDADAAGMGEAGHNPTTGVYRLTESIRTAGRAGAAASEEVARPWR